MKRVVISDLHIGSTHCREEDLLNFIQTIECDELILAGDVVDFIKIPSFTSKTAEILKTLSLLFFALQTLNFLGYPVLSLATTRACAISTSRLKTPKFASHPKIKLILFSENQFISFFRRSSNENFLILL